MKLHKDDRREEMAALGTMKQLAVEWLVKQLPLGVKGAILDKIEQAKKMEEMNIINTAVDIGCSDFHIDIHDAEQYYKENFKQQEQ